MLIKHSAHRYNGDLSYCREIRIQVCGGPLPVYVLTATSVTAK